MADPGVQRNPPLFARMLKVDFVTLKFYCKLTFYHVNDIAIYQHLDIQRVDLLCRIERFKALCLMCLV